MGLIDQRNKYCIYSIIYDVKTRVYDNEVRWFSYKVINFEKNIYLLKVNTKHWVPVRLSLFKSNGRG